MTQADVLKLLNPIFCDVFDDESISLTAETTAADVDGWDSVEHFNLISEIEGKFKMRFQMREVSGMKNVGELANIVAERGRF